MSKHTRQALIVGLLTLSCVLGAVVFLHSVRKGIGSGNAYRVWALLPDADGLYNKSRVMIAGIVVGEIISIKLVNNKARIDLWIRKDIRLYKDASIAKVSIGFLGDQALVLTRGSKIKGFIGDPGQITRIRKVGLMASVQKTLPKIQSAVPHVIKLTKALNDLSEGPTTKGRGSLRDIADSLRTVAQTLARSMKNNEARVNDIIRAVQQITRAAAVISRQSAGQIGVIVKDVKQVTKNLKRLSGDEKVVREILRNIRDLTRSFKKISGDVGPGANRLQKSIAHLERILKETRSIAGKINSGKGALGRLINDDRLVKKIENVVVNVTGLVNKISLLRVNVRWRADYYLLRGGFRTALQLALHPTPDKYYTIELVDDPRGAYRTTRTIRRTTDPRLPPVVNEEVVSITDSFRFTLQLNYRMFQFLTLRGGLIESAAGFGLDFLPWKDHVRIGAEIFNFGLENLPRLRMFAVLNYWFLTLTGGVDDLLNNGSRDFYVGLGLRFTDDDLKAILPILPIPR